MYISILISLFVSFFAQTTPSYLSDQGSIVYSMKHKLHAWDGKSEKLSIASVWKENKIEKIAVVTKISNFNSGLSSRDSHMIEVLEALTYPTINFISQEINYTEKGIQVKGKLQFHGVTKEISFLAQLQEQNQQLIFTGEFPVLLEDYKVERPSLLFVKADNLIKIRFNIPFKK